MAIIKDIAKLREFVKFDANARFTTLEPAIEQATESYLTPYLGDDLVQSLDTIANGGTYTAAEGQASLADLQALLPYIQRPLAFYAVTDFLPEAELVISTGGIYSQTPQNARPASERQLNSLLATLLHKADYFMDKAIEYLENNKDKYPEWTNHANYINNRALFIANSIEFSKYREIKSSRRTFMLLYNYMLQVQDTEIKGILGEAFYESFYEKWLDDDLSDKDKLLLPYIKAIVAHKAFFDGSAELHFAFKDGTVQVTSFLNSTSKYGSNKTAETLLSRLVNTSYDIAQRHSAKLKKFLDDNYSDYPDYEYDSDNASSTNITVAVDFQNNSNNNYYVGF